MSNDGLETIKALGIDRVHAETHISATNLEAIFTKSFEGMPKVQFLGFVSILEREYGVDLSGLKEEFVRYGEEHGIDDPSKTTIVPPSFDLQKKRKGWAYIVALVAGIVWVVYLIGSSPSQESAVPAPKKAPAETVKPVETAPAEAMIPEAEAEPLQAEPAEAVLTEGEADMEAAAVEPEAAEPEAAMLPEPVIHDTLQILPKVRLWVGMVDLESYKKSQVTTADPIVIDTTRSWLLIFGHGNLKIEHSGEIIDLQSKEPLYYHYDEGTLNEISESEFKRYNRGRAW